MMTQWRDFKERLPTKAELRTWFTAMPKANLGTVTGVISGIVVVDVDGPIGVRSARALGFNRTLTSRTGGGGYHLFYSTSEAILSRGRLYDGIDLKGEGGFVVLPPSAHISGKLYRWFRQRALAPADLSKLSPEPAYGRSGTTDPWVEELLDGVVEGNRSNSVARLAGRYFYLGLSLDETLLLMVAWNDRNRPPLSYVELERSIKAVGRRHGENGWSGHARLVNEIRTMLNLGKEAIADEARE